MTADTPSNTPPDGVHSSRTIILVSVVLLAAFTTVFWTFLSAQVGFAVADPGDWGHTLLVPFVVTWLIWSRRDELLVHPLRCSRRGLLVVCLGVSLYVLALTGPGLLQTHNARAVGVGVTVWGVALTIFGWGSLRILWFPLLYLVVFGQFLSDDLLSPVTERMQDVATVGSAFVFRFLGYDVVRHGALLTLDSGGEVRPLDVAEACSGMRMLMAFLALGTLLAWTRLPRAWQRVVLVLLAFPIAIAVNILRITTQGMLDGVDAELTVGAAHSAFSTIWLLPAFLSFMFFLWVLDGFSEESDPSNPVVSSVHGLRLAPGGSAICGGLLFFLLSCAIFLQSFLSMSGIRPTKSAAPLRAAFETLAPSLGDWRKQGDDLEYSQSVVDVLGTSAYLDRIYRRETSERSETLRVHLAHYTGGFTSRPHLPERCWSVQGLVQISETVIRPLDPDIFMGDDPIAPRRVILSHPITGEVETAWLPQGDPEVRVTVFSDPDQPGSRLLAGYFFVANGRLASGSRAARSLAYNLRDERAFFTKIQLASVVSNTELSSDELIESFVGMIADLLDPMMPEVMRLLPVAPGSDSDPLAP